MRRYIVLLLGIAAMASSRMAAAQNPTDLSSLDVIAVGPSEAPFPCTCVQEPFVLSPLPDPRYAGGLGVPLHPPRLSKKQLARQRAVFAVNDRDARLELSAAQAGEANSSFGIALN